MKSNSFISIIIMIFVILLIIFVIANIYRNNNMGMLLDSKKSYSSIDDPIPYERLPKILASCVTENNCSGIDPFNSLLV